MKVDNELDYRDWNKSVTQSEWMEKLTQMSMDFRKSYGWINESAIQSEWVEKLTKMSIDFRENYGWINELMIPTEQISKLVQNIENNLENVSSVIINSLQDVKYDKFNFNGDGTITYLNETINIQESIVELNECIESKGNWQQKLENLYKTEKAKYPIVAIIIVIIIKLIIGPFYEVYLDRTKVIAEDIISSIQASGKINNDKNKIIKDIKKEVLKEVSINNEENEMVKISLNQHRFVAVDCLNVRVNNSNDSRVIYNLKLGQVVRIIRKDKNWTLVEYTEGEDISIKGWVYTRYISKFK